MFRKFFVATILMTQACGTASTGTSEEHEPAAHALAAPVSTAIITACYASVEKVNPARDIEVSGSGRTRRFTSVAAAMDFVAEVHGDAALTVRYNPAGRAAMRAAMSCILDSGHVTLSAVVLNQKFEGLRVRSPEIAELDRTGTRVGNLAFVGVGTTCDGKPGLEFASAARTRTFPVDVYAHDFIGKSVRVEICVPSGLNPCSTACVPEESTHPSEPDSCVCQLGGGGCAKDISHINWGGGGTIAEVQPI